jgi:hypothetical protein
MKKLLLLLILGVIAGAMAAVASLVYQKLYLTSTGENFETLLTPAKIILSSIVGCIAAAVGYYLFSLVLKSKTEPVFNLLFAILTFVSFLGPIGFRLPLDFEDPGLFLGLTVPMHIFPAFAWMTLRPLFGKSISA